mmetsp:Transcript_71767/g.226743  ORF Transcript_71767/g.226743 Transcript_71767/m.226743 type:complete len:213 (-) Transcript_71767:643-1281(-)
MLAKGPACTSTGVSSRVCMRVGWMASFMSTVSAPPMPRSSASMGSPALEMPTTMRPRRSRMSRSEVVRASTAMISDATVMSKPVSRVMPFSVAFCPMVILRRKRSLVSSPRRHRISPKSRRANLPFSSSVRSSGSVLSIPSLARRFIITGAKWRLPALSGGQRRLKRAASLWVFSWKLRASMAAARRLLEAVMAWMSPVMWRLNSSIGMTWE